MEKGVLNSDWKPIDTAPTDTELELSIYDMGEFHALVFPCRHDGSSDWRDVYISIGQCQLNQPIGGCGRANGRDRGRLSCWHFQLC